MKKLLVLTLLLWLSSGCSSKPFTLTPFVPNNPSIIEKDTAIIKSQTVLLIESQSEHDTYSSLLDYLFSILILKTYAYNGTLAPSSTMTITYNLAATNVNFQLSFNGTVVDNGNDTITIGNFSLQSLDDNKLRVCPTSGQAGTGTQKCTTAAIRVMLLDDLNNPTSGMSSPTSDGLAPVTITDSTGQEQSVGSTWTILNSKNLAGINRLRQPHFSTVSPYTIKFDTLNAGSGDFSVKVLVEYVLYK